MSLQHSPSHVQQRGMGLRSSDTPERNGAYEAMIQPGGYLWPSLRLGRQAEISQQYDWDEWINQIGRTNQRRGHVMALGEIGVHYITDTEFRGMIFDKYPHAKKDRTTARRIYGSVYGAIKSHLEDKRYEQDSADRVKYFSPRPEIMGTALVDGHGRHHGPMSSALWHDSRFTMRTEDTVAGYDGNVLGVDLSSHREFYEERSNVLRFLARSEKFNTRPVRKDWSAHATIFRFHAHLSHEAVGFTIPGQSETPLDLHLEAPQIFFEK